MATINTNMSANIAANSMVRNERTMTSTMERLSTGLRINAEGAMKEVTNMFQRMRELAVQSISDSNTHADRGALNNEFKQLSYEISRIGENTQWNGTNILDGARTNSVFQIGANADQTIAVNFGDLSTNNATAAFTINASDLATIIITGAIATDDVVSYKVTDSAGNSTFATIGGTHLQSAATITSDEVETNSAGTVGDAETGAVIVTAQSAASTAFTIASASDGNDITISDVQVTCGTQAPVAASDITTRQFATTALGVLDTAIEGVNSTRATLGASMSRLEYAADNLQNVSQNSSAARSRVLDADYASETTELARTQIIQQASTAMLSQANQAQ